MIQEILWYVVDGKHCCVPFCCVPVTDKCLDTGCFNICPFTICSFSVKNCCTGGCVSKEWMEAEKKDKAKALCCKGSETFWGKKSNQGPVAAAAEEQIISDHTVCARWMRGLPCSESCPKTKGGSRTDQLKLCVHIMRKTVHFLCMSFTLVCWEVGYQVERFNPCQEKEAAGAV